MLVTSGIAIETYMAKHCSKTNLRRRPGHNAITAILQPSNHGKHTWLIAKLQQSLLHLHAVSMQHLQTMLLITTHTHDSGLVTSLSKN